MEQAQSNGDPRFKAILDEMWDLHQKKAADYGRTTDSLANLRGSAHLGISPFAGVLVRMMDKMFRLGSLVQNGKLANESAIDSLMDLACYGILGRMLLEEQLPKS